MEFYDAIVIGAGPAGLTAAIYLARAKRRTAVVEPARGGQATAVNEIENYPGVKAISGYELISVMREQAESFGATIIRGEVVRCDTEAKTVTLIGGETLCGGAIVLATGCKAKSLGLAGEDELTGKGVSFCAHCDGFFYRGKTVVAAGGGARSKEEAEYLGSVAAKTYYVTPSGEEASGCETVKGRVVELIGNPLKSVVVANGGETREIETDGLFVSVGYVPLSGLFHAYANEDGYVATDEKMRAGDGLYAVGDVRAGGIKQIVAAAADGAIAADDIIKRGARKR